jgi:glucoamylase
MTEALDRWAERQYAQAAHSMLMSISPLGIVKTRTGFGQRIVPKKGSVVASPVPASYDPDPDYFFHWYRDSAVVIDALRLLFEDGTLGPAALEHFADFVNFSLSLRELDGRAILETPWRAKVVPEFEKFLRSNSDLALAHGENILGETRVNADGTLDISSWPRPQHDGAAMRALAVLRWVRTAPIDADLAFAVSSLLRSDLAYARKRWRQPCFDIWEEEKGLHYYTLRISAAALEAGSDWLEKQRIPAEAQACRQEASSIRRTLDEYWLHTAGHYRSRILESGERSAKELDIAVILAAIHAFGNRGSHSVDDTRMHDTLACLERLFEKEYAINHNRPAARAPAMGRYAGDVYYSGGAYYFSTLGCAEFCYLAATGGNAQHWIRRGDEYLETVRAYSLPSGDLSEQFDRSDGRQTSAKHLAWSYAAFISCVAARRRAVA